jgi:ribosomal-protein-alanine N-acetyltransferase
MDQPTIHSTRILLRPFSPGDAAAVQLLAGEYEIADTTLSIPHPYEDGMAEHWISGHDERFQAEMNAVFAIVEKVSLQLIGAVSLTVDKEVHKAELGYWIGKPYWNQGYATDAAELIIDYGFKHLRLNRIVARHFVRNPASGSVMQKVGMVYEGTLRKDMIKWGKYEDLHLYSLLRDEWNDDGN